MKEEETVLCEKCGAEMHRINEPCTVGMECPNCGWGWVTTSPAISDKSTYSIFLSPIKSSVDHLKLISSIADCSYITAKKLIESAPVCIFSGSAPEVKSIQKKLGEAAIPYHIEPYFPY